jgi:hypothetical protein
LVRLAGDRPGVDHWTQVPELVRVGHCADRLDPPVEDVERPGAENLAVRSRRIASGWPFISCGSTVTSIRTSEGKIAARTRPASPAMALANCGALPPLSPTR